MATQSGRLAVAAALFFAKHLAQIKLVNVVVSRLNMIPLNRRCEV